MKTTLMVLAVVGCASVGQAQEPVKQWADVASYGTAAINPTVAAVEAWRSSSRGCRLGRLALSEAIGNGVTLAMKHWLVSPRPCLGCLPDGNPSGHSVNGSIGMLSSRWGFSAAVATGVLRHEANRHTWRQVGAGLLVGVGSEAAGRLIHCGG